MRPFVTKTIALTAALAATPLYSATTQAAPPGPPLPAAVSGFQGWRGVKLVRGRDCPECCNLAFPPEFGLRDPEELQALQSIVSKARFANDLSCVVEIDRDALRQIVKLAVKDQHAEAALVILRADTPGGMYLGGGERSEMLAPDYIVPVLLRYRRIGTLLDPELQRIVASRVCDAAYNPTSSADVDEVAVIATLKKRGAMSLAREIATKCEEVRKEFAE